MSKELSSCKTFSKRGLGSGSEIAQKRLNENNNRGDIK
jgi:hypothetical protein